MNYFRWRLNTTLVKRNCLFSLINSCRSLEILRDLSKPDGNGFPRKSVRKRYHLNTWDPPPSHTHTE